MATINGTFNSLIAGTLSGTIGTPGPQGQPGPQGDPGVGIPAGGLAGQVLAKQSGVDYQTEWVDQSGGGGAVWGDIIGTLSLQTDLATALAGKYSTTNPSGFITASALTPYLLSSTAASTYQTLSGMSAYLQKAGGYITGDIQSNNGSGYRTWNGTNLTAILSPVSVVFNNTSLGHGSLTVDADGITFYSSPYKQTQPFLGLAGYATESWVTAGFYPLTGNPSGFLTTGDGGTVPAGGTTGQILAKASSSDYSLVWESFIPGDRYLTTSTTSNTISNGTKTFTVDTGLSYTTQQDLTIAADPSNHMHGRVTSYDSGSGVLVVDITNHTGSGTHVSWTVNVGGTVPLASVAWGDITGTIGSQSDLATELNAKLDHAGGAIDANGSITASDTSTATDSELAGWGLGVQLSADHTKGTTVEFNGLDTYDGASHMQVTPTGLTFPDSTVQTTAGGAAVTNNNQLATTVTPTFVSYTLAYSDRNGIVLCQAGCSNITLTDSSEGWTPGQQVLIVNNSGYPFQIVTSGYATFVSYNDLSYISAKGVCAAVYIDTNSWFISGNLQASP